MSSGNSFSFDLYPGVDAELDAAFARNTGEDPAVQLGATGLAAAVNQAVTAPNQLMSPDTDPELLQKVYAALDASHQVLSLDSVMHNMPHPSHFDQTEFFGDIDWEQLKVSYAEMDKLGLEPEIIATPNYLPLAAWRTIYSDLGGITENGGLYVNSEVEKHWDEIGGNPLSDKWTLAVMPGASKPQLLGQPHNLDSQTADSIDPEYTALFDPSIDFADNYPSVNLYLMLQARRLQVGESPIDGETATWLAPPFDNNTKAPYGYWGPDAGQVKLFWRAPSSQRDDIGSRPAVRG